MNTLLHLVKTNPFYILGIFSDSKVKEKIANLSRIKAYSKVGKKVEFPIDIPDLFGQPDRSLNAVEEADKKLNLAEDQLRYSLFWFHKSSPLEEMAFNYLKEGNIDKSLEILSKKESYSTLINASLLYLLQDNLEQSLSSIIKVIDSQTYRESLFSVVSALNGQQISLTSIDLFKLYIDELAEFYPIDTILSALSNSPFFSREQKDYVANKEISVPLKKLESEIETIIDSKKPAYDLYVEIKKIYKKNSSFLNKISSLLGEEHADFINISDKIARCMLQESINYLNDIEEPAKETLQDVLKTVNTSLRIAKSEILKERIKSNKKVLINRIKAYDIDIVSNEILAISKSTVNCSSTSLSLEYLKSYFSDATNLLASVDKDDPEELCAPIKIIIAVTIVSCITAFINLISQQQVVQRNREQCIISVKDASSLLYDIRQYRHLFDKNFDTRYNQIKELIDNILSHIPSNTGYTSSRSSYRPSSSSSGGCYIATLVYGDYDHPQVMVLRHFRDNVLLKHYLGKKFVKFYYRYSPTWVEYLRNKKNINRLIKSVLNQFIVLYKKYAKFN